MTEILIRQNEEKQSKGIEEIYVHKYIPRVVVFTFEYSYKTTNNVITNI